MINHEVRVHPSADNLAHEDQLAYKIAKVAADDVEVTDEVKEMIINRIIDNASVAVASLNRAPIISAREIGRASCRERVWDSEGDGSLKRSTVNAKARSY